MSQKLLPLATLVAVLCYFCFGVFQMSADTLAQWTFESNVPQTIVGFSNGIVAPDFGTGSLSGHHASSSTTFTAGTGNGSVHSLIANTWKAGDYWLIEVSSAGYQHLVLSLDQAANPTGPTNFTLAYSLNGISFTNFPPNYQVYSMIFQGTWDSSTANSRYSLSVDLGSINALNNAADIYLKLQDNITPPAQQTASDYGYLDNVVVSASPIPEPSAVLLLSLGYGFVLARRRPSRP